jgi:hypothetical protein
MMAFLVTGISPMTSRIIKQFVIGDLAAGADFSTATAEAVIHKIAYWFSRAESGKTYEDPVAEAKKKFRECLLGVTDEGEVWRGCPYTFEKRIKAKCGYDMILDVGIPAPRNHRKIDKNAVKGAKEVSEMMPAHAGFNQEAYRATLEQDILAQYAELDNPAHLPLVRTISMYHSEREKIDRELTLGVNPTRRDLLLDSLRKLAVMTDTALQQLGIHPNQIKKNIDKRTASSVADLVQMIEGDDDYKKREKTWALQLALQLWWMSEHPNGKKDGPQLSDFEIWHMTRNRPVKFKCRHGEEYTVVEGFEPKDLFALLTKEGVLVEEPVLPLVEAGELKGLSAYFTNGERNDDGTDGSRGASHPRDARDDGAG